MSLSVVKSTDMFEISGIYEGCPKEDVYNPALRVNSVTDPQKVVHRHQEGGMCIMRNKFDIPVLKYTGPDVFDTHESENCGYKGYIGVDVFNPACNVKPFKVPQYMAHGHKEGGGGIHVDIDQQHCQLDNARVCNQADMYNAGARPVRIPRYMLHGHKEGGETLIGRSYHTDSILNASLTE